MNANFLRTKNYKTQLNLQQNQQVNNEPFPNIEINATTSYSNDAQTSKWNKFEQSEDNEAEHIESNRNKRLNVPYQEKLNNSGTAESKLIVKKSKWSDFVDDEDEELDLSQLNEPS